jgi:NAD(P)-dependent dehydrogenase (short-subunit alcohol dehydrogenase family)
MIDALVIGASGGIGRAVAAEMTARGGNVTPVAARRRARRDRPGLVARVMGALEGPFQTVFVSVGILAPDGQARKSRSRRSTPRPWRVSSR